MKTHKIKYGGDFTINGIDDTFRTYCGISSWNKVSEELIEIGLVGGDDECTCQRCNKSYNKEFKTITR